MESATLRPAVPPSGLVQVAVVGSLVALAAAGWAVTDERMGGMDAGPGTDLGGLGWFIVVWVTMMAAMMFPSIAPMVAAYAAVREGRPQRGRTPRAIATATFVAGYLVAWGTVGLVGYTVIEGARSLDLGFLAWDEAGRYIAAGVVLGAAAYQLTTLKDSCLRRCRRPQTFLREHWHPGGVGALRMGIEHGAFCVGCCWALMAALFALGVMSIGWMVFVAALIAIEKLLPWRAIANRTVAIVLAVLAIAFAIAPQDVPGLTVPGSPDAAEAMEAMGMEAEGGAMGDEEMAPAHDSMTD